MLTVLSCSTQPRIEPGAGNLTPKDGQSYHARRANSGVWLIPEALGGLNKLDPAAGVVHQYS